MITKTNNDELLEKLIHIYSINGYTQEELAHKLLIHRTTLSLILNGKRNLSKKLSIRIEEFLTSQSSEQEKEEVGA